MYRINFTQNYEIMQRGGWKWVMMLGVVLTQLTNSQAQDEPEIRSKLDQLPTWAPTDPRRANRNGGDLSSSDAPTYASLDDLLRQQANGRRVTSLVLTGAVLRVDRYRQLADLLRSVRVLTLNSLTTGQADSLLAQLQSGARLERLTIDITHLGTGRPDPERLVSLPVVLKRFRHLREIRIREDGLNWTKSVPVLVSIKSLRRLAIDRWSAHAENSPQPVLSTLWQLTTLRLSNSGWQLVPATIGHLPRLTELDLQGLDVNSTTLAAILAQLPDVETLRLTKCWRVEATAIRQLKQLKTVGLAYNDNLRIDSTLLAGWTTVERLTIKGGNQPLDLSGLGGLTRLHYLNVMGGRQVARLPANIDQLAHLTDLRLYDIKLGSLPEQFGFLRRLQTLHLNSCALDSLPATFGQLTALRDLTLYSNNLSQLPDLTRLKKLRYLNVTSNRLTELPVSIGQLTSLTALNASENQLTELPASVGQLTNLANLSVEHNRLERLPDALGQLTRLINLSVGSNQIKQLPASLCQLTSLTAMSVDYNQLTQLPDELGKLRHLRFFSLGNNQLATLPNSVGQLDSLRYLWIGRNHLRVLPADFGQLRALTNLAIDGNELTELPADLGNLNQLIDLSLTNLPLKALPASIGSLTNLRQLIIENTPLSALPDSVGNLANLRYVRLTNNALTTLPNSIGGWQSVTKLELYEARLNHLPNGMSRMTSLTELTIGDERKPPGNLRQLPDSVVHCKQLRTLSITNQPRLDADDVFGKTVRLKNLRELSVVNCQIDHLPDLAWASVPWQKLHLDQNRLTALPTELVDAPELQYITAQNNQLPPALNRSFSNRQDLLSAFAEAGQLPPDIATRSRGKLTEALLRSAHEKWSANELAGAMTALNEAVRHAPDSIRSLPYGERSSLHYVRKQYAEALADLDSAIRYTPDLRFGRQYDAASIRYRAEHMWQQKASILGEMGQYDAALANLAQAERVLPVDSLANYGERIGAINMERGRYLTRQGNFARAETAYRKAVDAFEANSQTRPPYVTIYNKVKTIELCLLTGQYDRASRLITSLKRQSMRVNEPIVAGNDTIYELTDKQLERGYGTLLEYMRYCLAILSGSASSSRALAEFQAYCAAHPKELRWRFTLTDDWLGYKNVSETRRKAFRALQQVAESRLIQPRP